MSSRSGLVRALVVIGVVAIIGFLAWRYLPQYLEPPASGLSASGTIEATESRLGFQGAGRIETVAPREGDAVKAGDELARLDRAELLARREQAQAQVAAADAILRDLEHGSRSEEIAQARAALYSANKRLSDAKRDLDRAKRLYEGGAVGAEARDKATMAHDLAASQTEQARQQLQLLEVGPRLERIEAQRAQVTQAQAAVRVFDAMLENMLIKAPIDGIVTVRHREPGETVAPGMPVLTLMNPANRWVRIYVPEPRVGQIKLGGSAEITTDSFAGKVYRGQVVYIASQAEFTPKSVQTTEERVKLVYAVKLRITGDTELELKPGMPADVRLDSVAP